MVLTWPQTDAFYTINRDYLQEQVEIVLAVMDISIEDLDTAVGLVNLLAQLTRKQVEILTILVKENEELNRGLRNEGH